MRYLIIIPAVFMLLISCTTNRDKKNDQTLLCVQQISDEVRQLYIPDRRVAVFDVEYDLSGENLIIDGATTSDEAKAVLFERLREIGLQPVDSMILLPDSLSLAGSIYGVVNLSVANLHSKADFSSEMVTQALLGMPVKVLEFRNWYRIQTPDNYIAWVHRAGIKPMNKLEINSWNQSLKVIVTSHYGFTYTQADEQSQTVSDIVAGNRFKYLGTQSKYYKIMYPDGREAYISKEIAAIETDWRKSLKQDANSILNTAYTLKGVPYLWAGTSSKGMDCSGFIRNVLYMHDVIMPRDASQQAYVGNKIEADSDFSNLKTGDLIFFGRKATNESKERIVHVGIYIGNKKFIHSQGDVRIGSFEPKDHDYDEFNLNRMLFATRILDSIGTPEINTTVINPYYLQH